MTFRRLLARLSASTSPLIAGLLFASAVGFAQQPGGLKPGAKAPAFALSDQSGHKQSIDSLAGPNGLLLLFFRSADWCPFCKGQLVDLEGAQKAFAAKGINVAAISYDSPAILADFTARRHITYPLLSDKNSSVIDKFGIRNPEGTGIEAGIPYPGYYLIDRQGTIQKRFFETAYVNRLTANNVYANIFGDVPLPLAPRTVDATPHVAVSLSQSDTDVAPGAIVRVSASLTPGNDTHLYAPGAEKQQFIVTSLVLDKSPLYTSGSTVYPQSVPFHFQSLNETVPVFTGHTDLVAAVAANVSSNTLPVFAKDPHLSVKGHLVYQACTSTVCFPPVKIPVEWTINLRALDLERAPANIQHK